MQWREYINSASSSLPCGVQDGSFGGKGTRSDAKPDALKNKAGSPRLDRERTQSEIFETRVSP